MKIKKTKLRRIIREELEREVSSLNESWFSKTLKSIGDLGGMISGTSKMKKAVEEKTTPDAWSLFKALVGPGTDTDSVRQILFKRKDELKKLSSEFDDLIKLSLKSLEITKEDSNAWSFSDGDDVDINSSLGTAALVVGSVASLALGLHAGAFFLGATGFLAGKLGAGMVQLGYGIDKKSTPWGKTTKKRREEREKTKGHRGKYQKIYTKLVGTVKDKPLSQYLRDDGMAEEADILDKAIAGKKEVVPQGFKESNMKISKSKLRKIIKEHTRRILLEKPFKMPDSYYDPPDDVEIPDEIYDDLEDIFERAARSPKKRYKFVGTEGDYILIDETETVGDALPLYRLIDPSGRDEDFYLEEEQDISALEDRIIDVLMKNYSRSKADADASYHAERWD